MRRETDVLSSLNDKEHDPRPIHIFGEQTNCELHLAPSVNVLIFRIRPEVARVRVTVAVCSGLI